MIISRTPYRLSLAGGGSDYPNWFESYGGAVVGLTINKYCFLTVKKLPRFFEHANRVVWSNIELTDTIADIKHPGVRETLRYLHVNNGIEIHHVGDLPARSGLGSSSAFVVGLLNAIYAARGQTVSSRRLALEAIHIERELANEAVGFQDQILTAYGGLNHVIFTGLDFEVHKIHLPPNRLAELQAHLLLIYTGSQRNSAPLATSFIDMMPERKAEMHRTCELVSETLKLLHSGAPLLGLGNLMREGWELKKQRGRGISTARIDALYGAALAAGATGGKIVGAGGAGFMLLVADPARHAAIGASLGNDGCVPVSFKFETDGAVVIHNDELAPPVPWLPPQLASLP